MARYLRDEQVANLSIDPDAVSYLVDVFVARSATMPNFLKSQQQQDEPNNVFLRYTIRFDQKGYRVFDKNLLLRYFQDASEVERIIFELDCGKALRTNRDAGSFMELRLDKGWNTTNLLTVSSDDEDWVNGSFAALKEATQKYKNRNLWIRNPYVELLIQITGLFLGFLVSLWGASKVSPYLTIENAFLISFLLVLLIFSNLWTHINQRLYGFVFRAFPIIRFNRPERDRLNWLKQTVVGGIVVAVSLYVLNVAFAYVGKMLGAFIGGGT